MSDSKAPRVDASRWSPEMVTKALGGDFTRNGDVVCHLGHRICGMSAWDQTVDAIVNRGVWCELCDIWFALGWSRTLHLMYQTPLDYAELVTTARQEFGRLALLIVPFGWDEKSAGMAPPPFTAILRRSAMHIPHDPLQFAPSKRIVEQQSDISRIAPEFNLIDGAPQDQKIPSTDSAYLSRWPVLLRCRGGGHSLATTIGELRCLRLAAGKAPLCSMCQGSDLSLSRATFAKMVDDCTGLYRAVSDIVFEYLDGPYSIYVSINKNCSVPRYVAAVRWMLRQEPWLEYILEVPAPAVIPAVLAAAISEVLSGDAFRLPMLDDPLNNAEQPLTEFTSRLNLLRELWERPRLFQQHISKTPNLLQYLIFECGYNHTGFEMMSGLISEYCIGSCDFDDVDNLVRERQFNKLVKSAAGAVAEKQPPAVAAFTAAFLKMLMNSISITLTIGGSDSIRIDMKKLNSVPLDLVVAAVERTYNQIEKTPVGRQLLKYFAKLHGVSKPHGASKPHGVPKPHGAPKIAGSRPAKSANITELPDFAGAMLE